LDRSVDRIRWPTFVGLGVVVVSFMVLSLSVTATGTARFTVAIGYDARLGYAVGAVFDLAKGLLLVAVLALLARRAFCTAALLGIAWMCLVAYSCLATHATVGMAISGIERAGSWKMEVRSNDKAELASVEQQLGALSRPTPPRPAKTVREALAGERVPTGIWQDSRECVAIQESVHFAKACAQVVQLRRELAAAQDYERLSTRAGELRSSLAAAPIVATSDPLPAAFSATVGRALPIGGAEGVALLLTAVVEIISCFGLAGLRALGSPREQHLPQGGSGEKSPASEGGDASRSQAARPKAEQGLPQPSLKAVPSGGGTPTRGRGREGTNPPSNVVPIRPPSSPRGRPKGNSPTAQGGLSPKASADGSHIPAFVQERLQKATGSSLASKDLRAAYEAWCAKHGYQPLTLPNFAAELKARGYEKWKSSGLMRYRDMQLVA
jgi:Poxvirus D5 protein-like